MNIMKFNPPTIKTNNSKYKVEDILVLHELNKRPTFVSSPLETFSGHKHSSEMFKSRDIFLDFVKVVANLQKNELIRKSQPQEVLNHLTIAEMKVILKAISKPISGTRDLLINRIKSHASEKDINDNTDKSCFVLTTLGLDILKKYKNVLWIHEHKKEIFRYPLFYKSNFDEYYFMEHWDLNPSNTIINYYESKNSGAVARIYQIENNPQKSFLYALRQLTEEVNLQIEKCKEVGWFNTSAGLGEFLALNTSPELGETLSFKAIFKSLNISDDNLDEILRYIYDFAITDSSLVTFDHFNDIMIALLTNSSDEQYRELLEDLSQSIRKKFGHKCYYENTNNYHERGFDDEEGEVEEESLKDILDILAIDDNRKLEMVLELIDDLDLETIKKVEVKVNKRLMN